MTVGLVCPFCSAKLGELPNYQRTHECVCGAKYLAVSSEDNLLEKEVGEAVGLPPTAEVEVRWIQNFDVMTDTEGQDLRTGERYYVMFAREVKPG